MESETPEQEAPVEAPAPAPSADTSIDELLAQYDAETKRLEAEPAAEPNQAENGNVDGDELDRLLQSLNGPDPRVGELETQLGTANDELNALKAEALWKAEREAFEGFSKKLQDELGPNVPDDYARTQLIALASEKPELEIAWRWRNLTNEQIAAADREFQQLEAMHRRVQQTDDPRKAQVLAQLEARGQELGLMMNARKMLNNAWADVVKRARKVAPPIDQEMTAMRAEISAAVRGASTPVPPEAPPNLGRMTDQEYRRYLQTLNIAGF